MYESWAGGLWVSQKSTAGLKYNKYPYSMSGGKKKQSHSKYDFLLSNKI